MKILTSYFYTVRYMPRYFLPISTAKWDPRWFHDFRDPTHYFIDGRGVLNGIRCYPLVPGKSCEDLCRGTPCKYTPDSCEFLKKYEEQLNDIDLSDFLERLSALTLNVVDFLNDNRTELDSELGYGDIQPVFLFHEMPSNPCSERIPFTKWAKNFSEVEEFDWRKMK